MKAIACRLLVWGTFPLLALARPLKNRDGVIIEAEIVRVEGDRVIITRNSDGVTFAVPIAKLSDADQAYIKSLAPVGDKPEPSVADAYKYDTDLIGKGCVISFLDGGMKIQVPKGAKLSTLTFVQGAEVTILRSDKLVRAANAGIEAADDRKQTWVSRAAKSGDEELFAFFPKRS